MSEVGDYWKPQLEKTERELRRVGNNFAECERELAAARSTISELETRIESLLSDNGEVALMHIKAEQALTSERQRREECEALLGRWFHGFSVTLDGRGIKPATNAYFRKYEPIPADREEGRRG